jgi:hypothetical protein
MTFSATLSHLRRIIIPIGKEGKNTKLRQTHSSQIMYICPNECFTKNTPILLWNGSIKLAKDIIVGDLLIDDNGNPTRVRSTCSGMTTMYEIQQEKENFTNYTVTNNHILTLKIKYHKYVYIRNRLGYKYRKDGITYELKWFDKDKLSYNNRTFHNMKELNLLKDTITDDNTIDITIENYLKLPDSIKKCLAGFKSSGINWDYQEVNLDNLLSIIIDTKDLPNNYIINDRNTRLKVLAILSEYYWNKTREYVNEIRIEVYKDYKIIINKILFLISSLGFSYYINDIYNKNKLSIYITGEFLYEIPLLERPRRKKYISEIARKRCASFLQSPIKVIEKGIDEFVGWQLEGNGRFLHSDFTVLHNTPEGYKKFKYIKLDLALVISKRYC